MVRVVVRSRENKMSCFRAFDSNLPVLDVQIMGAERVGGERGADRKKGFEGQTAAANSNLQVKKGTRPSSLFGRGLACSRRSERILARATGWP